MAEHDDLATGKRACHSRDLLLGGFDIACIIAGIGVYYADANAIKRKLKLRRKTLQPMHLSRREHLAGPGPNLAGRVC
jgi:hypothetical protein